MAEDWAGVAREIGDAIADVGFAALLEQPGSATGPDYDPVRGSATLLPITVIDDQIRRRDGNGTITEAVRVLTIAATGPAPVKGWRVVVRGAYHRIAQVMPLAPGGVDLLFDIELEA
jgi:hypothetical protein